MNIRISDLEKELFSECLELHTDEEGTIYGYIVDEELDPIKVYFPRQKMIPAKQKAYMMKDIKKINRDDE